MRNFLDRQHLCQVVRVSSSTPSRRFHCQTRVPKEKLRSDSKRLPKINFSSRAPKFCKGCMLHDFGRGFKNHAAIFHTEHDLGGARMFVAVPAHVGTKWVPSLISTGVLAVVDHF
jgi:hypothetical protein